MTNSLAIPILQPVVALLIWSLVVTIWVLATRIPAMVAMKVVLDPNVPPKDLTRDLPAKVRWKADNYNHLMEAPTLFYAAALVVASTDPANGAAVTAAWAYVTLRFLHSVVQSTINHIPSRLFLFVLSTIALSMVLWHGARAVFAAP